MASKNASFRKSVRRKNYKPVKDLIVFRYGVLGEKKFAKGYCIYHSCFISSKDLHSKHCSKKCCKYYNRDVEVYV